LPLNDIFQVDIVTSSPGLTSTGFGKPLILGAYGKTWTEKYRQYADLDSVGDDFLATDPEYLMAARLFQQDPRPPLVGIGRGVLPPTQKWSITPTVANSSVYTIRVGDETFSYTSDADASLAEIVAGLVAKINHVEAIWVTLTPYVVGDRRYFGDHVYECITAGTTGASGPTGTTADITDGTVHWAYVSELQAAWQTAHVYIAGTRCSSGGRVYECITGGTSDASSPPVPPSATTANITDGTVHWKYIGAAVTATNESSTHIHVTLTNAGGWQALEVGDVNLLSIVQDHVNPGVATDLAAVKLLDNSWYVILYPWNSAACILAIAAWAEAAKKLFVAQTQDSTVPMTVAAGATDIAATLKAASYSWSPLWYHPATDGFLDSGISGVCLPTDPGAETWKFKQPAGVPVTTLNPTQKANLDGKNCNYYYDVGSDLYITGEGKVPSGEWIDVVRGRDAAAAEIQTEVINAVTDTAVSKISYDDSGIQVIAQAVLSALRRFEKKPGLLIALSSVVTSPKAADVSDADRSARVLNGVTWVAQLQSAIHSGVIRGTVTY
jgi:hypothetical protein